MPSSIEDLFVHNRAWAAQMERERPGFFTSLLAQLEGTRVGLADNWIRHVQDVRDRHRDLIAATAPEWRHDVLCELNAIEQVVNIAQTTVMLDAWGRGQKVTLHGWCYGLKDGLINNLHMSVGSTEGLDSLYKAAIAGVAAVKRQ